LLSALLDRHGSQSRGRPAGTTRFEGAVWAGWTPDHRVIWRCFALGRFLSSSRHSLNNSSQLIEQIPGRVEPTVRADSRAGSKTYPDSSASLSLAAPGDMLNTVTGQGRRPLPTFCCAQRSIWPMGFWVRATLAWLVVIFHLGRARNQSPRAYSGVGFLPVIENRRIAPPRTQ